MAKKAKSKPEAPRCPECAGVMVTRTGPHGEFWGCPRFPSCRGSRSIRPKPSGGLPYGAPDYLLGERPDAIDDQPDPDMDGSFLDEF
jgi:ssDNA-binding Zn-finger/Zn-ribbon topoisomerase 1